MANFNDKLIVLENMPEVLEELEVTDDVVSMADDDDMSTVMGDGDDEENVEKQMMKEEGGNAFTAIGEEDDLANIVFQGHTDSVYCADINEIHPGMVISGGGDDKAFIWQFPVSSDLVESNEQVGVSNCIALEGHTDTVTSVGFNFDATLALTASYDGTVRIWNVDTGELIHILDGPEEIEWACWHSKGNAVIAGSRDGTIWMWLAHNGQCLQVFAGHEGCVSAGDFTIDGKYIVTGGEDGSVRVWAPKTGQCKHIFEGAHESLVTCLATSKKDPDVILSGKNYTRENSSRTSLMANDDVIIQSYVRLLIINDRYFYVYRFRCLDDTVVAITVDYIRYRLPLTFFFFLFFFRVN